MSSPILSNMQQTAQAFFDGYNTWDIDAIMSTRAEDCVFITLPKSLRIPDRNNLEYARYLEEIMPIFKNFKVGVSQLPLYTTNR